MRSGSAFICSSFFRCPFSTRYTSQPKCRATFTSVSVSPMYTASVGGSR